jgi:hypothetical protein
VYASPSPNPPDITETLSSSGGHNTGEGGRKTIILAGMNEPKPGRAGAPAGSKDLSKAEQKRELDIDQQLDSIVGKDPIPL